MRFDCEQAPVDTARDGEAAMPVARIQAFHGRAAAIDEIARALHASVETRDILTALAVQARRVLDFDRFEVVLRGENRVDHTLHTLGDRGGSRPASLVARSLSVHVLGTGEAVLLGDLGRGPDLTIAEAGPRLRAALGVPLRADGEVIGTLEFYAHTAGSYDTDDLRIAHLLALPVTSALRNAMLYTRERRRGHKMQALFRVGAAATTTLDRDLLLEEACRQISAEFGYYKVNLATVDATHVRIAPRHRLFHGRTLAAELPADEIPRNVRSLMTIAANERRTVHAADVDRDPHYYAEPGTATRSEVAIPIVWRGVTLGLLDVQSEQVHAFADEDIQLLSMLANQLAAGLENCRLYDQVNNLLDTYVPANVARQLRASADRPVAGGERQQISVLFADLRGFTRYAEGHDPERLLQTLNACLEVATEAITEFGGTLDKFMGDACMALFNAPDEQPDHALRAVAAAMRIQERMGRLGRIDIAGLQFGIGVNTGDAVVGNIGTSTMLNYTAIGDAVNIAKRLEERAAGGELIISAGCHDRVRGHVDAEPLGPLELHGRREPVYAYLLRALHGPPAR